MKRRKKSESSRRKGKSRAKAEALAGRALENPAFLPKILEDVGSREADVKFPSAMALVIVSEKSPEMLYPKFGFFVELLDSKNKIIKWSAMSVIANLTRVDKRKAFEGIFERYYDLLKDESMVTAANLVGNSARIALAKPHLTDRITEKLLSVEAIPRGEECRSIIMGAAILAFDEYYDQIRNKEAVLSFARGRLSSKRSATRKKAEDFLRKRERPVCGCCRA